MVHRQYGNPHIQIVNLIIYMRDLKYTNWILSVSHSHAISGCNPLSIRSGTSKREQIPILKQLKSLCCGQNVMSMKAYR